MSAVDYSLYLVTGRELLPPGKDYLESLEQSIQGGVSIVQIREKTADSREFLDIAHASKAICARYNVPLLINDRLDIALAVGADGVHLGQTDVPVPVARRLLPAGTLVGVSCNTVDDVRRALADGADYVGVGAVWGTQTKALTSPILGVRAVGALLEALDGSAVKVVAIGGIKSTNLLRTLHGSVSATNHALDGVAVVSDIVASREPRLAAQKLAGIVRAFKAGPAPQLALAFGSGAQATSYTAGSILAGVAALMAEVRRMNPLIHQITNTVVTTQSANATLALGASPIMANTPEEMEDLARIPGALLLNMGTLTKEPKAGMLEAGHFANVHGKPVVFDPVGVGASAFRKAAAKELLDTLQATVIKGNAGELAALAGSLEVESKGVDSVGPGFKDPAGFVRALARKERCIVALTGVTDFVSDGTSAVALRNGHALLGVITGSGCMVGTCVATFCAAAASLARAAPVPGRIVGGDMLLGAVTGILALTIAAEVAAARADVHGSGTFLPAFIDELGALTPEVVAARAKIDILP